MKAIIIGPGRIGCGFVGELLRASGYDLVFVGRNREMTAHFNRVGSYGVKLCDGGKPQFVRVAGVRAVWAGNTEAVAKEIADADLIATSVGPQNLAAVAPLIAAGLALRRTPVNIIAFENLINAGACLRRMVKKALRNHPCVDDHGFSSGLVSRVVTQKIGDTRSDCPLVFVADGEQEFIVERKALKGSLPAIRGMKAVDNYGAYVLRKLYTFSAGHATTAYLGSLKGYHYIHTAIRDAEIRAAVLEAMAEGQRGLASRYGAALAGTEADLQKIIRRFENATLNDPILRVGRDVRRKLGANERLVGAARMAAKAGIAPEKLAFATAAAFCFCNPADPGCDELRQSITTSGIDVTLNELCGLECGDAFTRSVATSWQKLSSGWKRGNLLLSLNHCMWAWS